jgi:isopenicillin-N N-acyltransferase-like protein
MDVETVPGGGDGVFVTRPDPPDRHLAHTNHFTHPGFNGIDVELDVGPGSFLRLRRAEELLRRRDRSVESYLEDIFRDHEGLPTSICAHGDEASPPPERVATVFSVVMDPDARTLRIADGSPCETPYRTVDYSDLLAPSTVA